MEVGLFWISGITTASRLKCASLSGVPPVGVWIFTGGGNLAIPIFPHGSHVCGHARLARRLRGPIASMAQACPDFLHPFRLHFPAQALSQGKKQAGSGRVVASAFCTHIQRKFLLIRIHAL